MGSTELCPNCRAKLPFKIADQIALAREKGYYAACPYCSCNLEFFQRVQPKAAPAKNLSEEAQPSEPPPFQRYYPHKPEPPSTTWLGAEVPAAEKPFISPEKKPHNPVLKNTALAVVIAVATLISGAGFLNSALGSQIMDEIRYSRGPDFASANKPREVAVEMGETMFLYAMSEPKAISLTVDGVEDLGTVVGDYVAEPGYKLVGMDFTISNNSAENVTMYLNANLNWVNGNGYEMHTVPMAYTGLIPNQATPSLQMQPEVEFSGKMYFSVPTIIESDYTICIQNYDYSAGNGERVDYMITVDR